MNQVRSLEGLHKTLIAEFNWLEIFRQSRLSRPAELHSAACLRCVLNDGIERARHLVTRCARLPEKPACGPRRPACRRC